MGDRHLSHVTEHLRVIARATIRAIIGRSFNETCVQHRTVCGEREIEGSLKDPPCKGEWLDQRLPPISPRPSKIAMIKAKMLTRSNFKACLRMPRVHKANIYSPWRRRNRRNNRSITKLNLPPKMISRIFSPPLSVDSFEGVKHGFHRGGKAWTRWVVGKGQGRHWPGRK